MAHKPFETQADPANPGPFRVPNFSLPQGVTLERLGDRRELLSSFDSLRRDVDASGQMEALDRFGQQAWDILTSPAARDAFDLDREPADGPRALRLHAGVRSQGVRTAAAPRRGASASCWPAGWSRRACGW